ncbi:MAG: hypothetical protein JNN29_00510 [Chitinophagaceae bacterium]|nr:hypothetical protein [Chitinophagaceae bacterium]MBN8668713.1 hypothetical protein [Chitinophagales bacterium]
MKTIVPIVRTMAFATVLFLFTQKTQGQAITLQNGKVEVGLGIGPSFFLGDLGGQRGIGQPFIKDINIPLTKLSKGIYLNLYPAEWIGFRVSLNHMMVEGDDAEIDNKGGREISRLRRNLYFKSNITEAYAALELYPTVFLEQYDGLQGKIRPYGLIGIGAFHFNPKGYYIGGNGQKTLVDLKPLRLEGQGMAEYPEKKEYSLTQLEVPMGFGFKYYVKENLYVGLEILHRKTFTDYVDDVSTSYIDPIYFDQYLTPEQATWARQLHYRTPLYEPTTRPFIGYQRGDPKENDAFFTTVLRFGWRINGDNTPNSRARRQMRCPKYF